MDIHRLNSNSILTKLICLKYLQYQSSWTLSYLKIEMLCLTCCPLCSNTALPPASYCQTHHALEMPLSPTSYRQTHHALEMVQTRSYIGWIWSRDHNQSCFRHDLSASPSFMSFFAHRYKEVIPCQIWLIANVKFSFDCTVIYLWFISKTRWYRLDTHYIYLGNSNGVHHALFSFYPILLKRSSQLCIFQTLLSKYVKLVKFEITQV